MTTNICGVAIEDIQNKEFLRIETANAAKIAIALDKSDIPFYAKFDDTQITITYDGDYSAQVESIFAKAQSGEYEAMLRELKTSEGTDSYLLLLPEVADILHSTVGTLQARPEEVKLALCKTYADFWLCDNVTIQRELDRIISVNSRAQTEMEQARQREQENVPIIQNEMANTPILDPLVLADIHNREVHIGFSRERHRQLSELARRRQSERQRVEQNEEQSQEQERERKLP